MNGVKNIAGRLRNFVTRWEEITSDRIILDYIKGYKIPFTQTPSQRFPPKEKIVSAMEREKIRREIKKLLLKGAIEECEECEGQFCSPYFLVPKADGSSRFIFNLKELNKFINPPHFKLEDIRSALGLVSPGDYLGTLDLKDAYFLVPIYSKHKKFLRFRFQGRLYQFSVLPFGLCSSPYIFTKIMKPVLNKLRLDGALLVLYLDDFLFVNKSKIECEGNIKTAVRFLENLGFVINFQKSSLTASKAANISALLLIRSNSL